MPKRLRRRLGLALGLFAVVIGLIACGRVHTEPRASGGARASRNADSYDREVSTKDTIIYLVRHAEKAEAEGSDPELSPRGRARAKALVQELRDEPIDRIFATEYQRTQQTVGPLASEVGIKVVLMEAGATAEMATRCLEEFLGEVVVIAGHSNTVPKLINALGIDEVIDIAEKRYGDLFVVRLEGEGREASLQRRRFGG